jgi:hypothetical protein
VIDGFRLEFDNGDVFRAKSNVEITHQTTPIYLIDGFRNLQKLLGDFIDSGSTGDTAEDSDYKGVFAGFGAGVHTIRIQFIQFEGSSEQWGSSSAGDSALSKLQTLNHTITTTPSTSRFPAILSTGEYGAGGKYQPLAVALGETDLSFDAETQASGFSGTLELYDAVDLRNAVSSHKRVVGP